jgi:hypothetical protein
MATMAAPGSYAPMVEILADHRGHFRWNGCRKGERAKAPMSASSDGCNADRLCSVFLAHQPNFCCSSSVAGSDRMR